MRIILIFLCLNLNAMAENVSCSQLTENFCNTLWSNFVKGNYQTKKSTFLLGRSKKSGYRHTVILDDKALLSAQEKILKHLKERGASQEVLRTWKKKFKHLEKHLEKENSSKEWAEEFDRLHRSFSRLFKKTGEGLSYKKYSYLKDKPNRELTRLDKVKLTHDYQVLLNKILEFKYKDSSQWQNIQTLFQEARGDLLLVISQLNLSENEKKRWSDKLKSVELSLPYSDPRILSDWETCSEIGINAFYLRSANKFTICAGSLNVIESTASLYRTIAHELSHSIDPQTLALDEYEKSEARKVSKKLYQKEIDCEEWHSIKEDEYSSLEEILKPVWETDHLRTCLTRKEINPYQTSEIRRIAQSLAKKRVSHWADNNEFTYFISPTKTVDYYRIKNDFYRKPQSFGIEHNKTRGTFFKTGLERKSFVPVIEVFNQELNCYQDKEGKLINFFHSTNEQQRLKIFDEAIAETVRVSQSILERLISYTGPEERTLQPYGLAKQSGENFADWLAFKAIELKLKRIINIEERRSFLVESNANYCDNPGPLKEFANYTVVEKDYGLEPHGANKARRLSIFTKNIRALAQCDADENSSTVNQFGDCEL